MATGLLLTDIIVILRLDCYLVFSVALSEGCHVSLRVHERDVAEESRQQVDAAVPLLPG